MKLLFLSLPSLISMYISIYYLPIYQSVNQSIIYLAIHLTSNWLFYFVFVAIGVVVAEMHMSVKLHPNTKSGHLFKKFC